MLQSRPSEALIYFKKILEYIIANSNVAEVHALKLSSSALNMYTEMKRQFPDCMNILRELGITNVSHHLDTLFHFNDLPLFLENLKFTPLGDKLRLELEHQEIMSAIVRSELGQAFELALAQSYLINGGRSFKTCDQDFIKKIMTDYYENKKLSYLCNYYGVKLGSGVNITVSISNLKTTMLKMNLENQARFRYNIEFHNGSTQLSTILQTATPDTLMEKSLAWWHGFLLKNRKFLIQATKLLPILIYKIAPLLQEDNENVCRIVGLNGNRIKIEINADLLSQLQAYKMQVAELVSLTNGVSVASSPNILLNDASVTTVVTTAIDDNNDTQTSSATVSNIEDDPQYQFFFGR